MYVAGVVLAAGSSVRLGLGLGEAKQLLPYRGRTLLDATLDNARACRFDQLVVTLGGAAAAIGARVDLTGCVTVAVPSYELGCGFSIGAAVEAIDPRADGFVLLLGDQPGVRASAVAALLAACAGGPLGVCRYDDGLGHPFWFRRDVFGALRELHGDKAVWKLLQGRRAEVTETPVPGPVPIDVDTREDYERLLAGDRLVH
jgi:molybdenum cofactor cytidylyltransferase